jgi:hypothetical protein
MKKKKISLIILSLLFVSITSSLSMTIIQKNPMLNSNIFLSSGLGVSNYEITQGVTYEVELNYTLIHTRMSPQSYYFKVARLNDRQPNSTITQYTPPYQQSHLLYNSIMGYDSLILGSLDQFNNTYDLFNATLAFSENITLSQKYIITLNEITFGDISSSEIGMYDTSDEMFELYCNNSELYYERDDLDLINASNSIVNPLDNPLEKAEKIANWVADYLTYDGNLPAGEMGAAWAYNNRRGDCSEYSSLMITLLRIQGIPARKVTGFLLSSNSALKPAIGETFNFSANSLGSINVLGHAWVEYYIPDIGWIAAEPQNPNYYKKIDFLRFNLNIGAWFFMPGATPPFNYVSEFPYIPIPVCVDHDAYSFNYNITIKVLETNYNDFNFLILLIIIAIIGSVILIITLIIRSGRKKKSKLIDY